MIVVVGLGLGLGLGGAADHHPAHLSLVPRQISFLLGTMRDDVIDDDLDRFGIVIAFFSHIARSSRNSRQKLSGLTGNEANE